MNDRPFGDRHGPTPDEMRRAFDARTFMPPRPEPSRYNRLGPLARALVDDYDALDLAEMLVKAQDELAALRMVARGYCPHYGRGDAGVTTDQWEQQRKRADQAETQVEQHRHLRAVAGIHFRAIGHLLNDAGIRLPDNVARLCQLLDDELTLTLDELAERHPAVLDRPTAGPAATQATDDYEQTTGHQITCAAGFADTCTCNPKEN